MITFKILIDFEIKLKRSFIFLKFCPLQSSSMSISLSCMNQSTSHNFQKDDVLY
eukprot:m.45999 g.45999  ORF g.45999 m.45999 type:complete len:54 (+) comp10321_c0_seq1:3087-3248(+)